MGDLAHPRLKPLGLPPVGRATRGHALLTKTLLIIGQEGTTQRSESGPAAVPGFEVRDSTLRAYDKATGKLVGRGGAATQRDGSADDLHAERQAIHRRPDRGRQPACGTHRALAALTRAEAALATDWSRPEEDAAWLYLQPPSCLDRLPDPARLVIADAYLEAHRAIRNLFARWVAERFGVPYRATKVLVVPRDFDPCLSCIFISPGRAWRRRDICE